MPILFKGKAGDLKMSPSEFSGEDELKGILTQNPELLLADGEPPAAVAGEGVNLSSAGETDLLLVDSEGFPMTVDVLVRGSDFSAFIACALDNASSISRFNAKELDRKLEGKLGGALESFYSSLNDYFAVERRWEACEAYLSQGKIRIILAVDEVSPDMIRLAKFIGSNANFFVRLVAIRKYELKRGENLLIPEMVVRGGSVSDCPRVRFLAAADAYSIVASGGFKLSGQGFDRREIHPNGWGSAVYYGLRDSGAEDISVGVYVTEEVSGLNEELSALEGDIAGAVKWGITRWSNEGEDETGRLEIAFNQSTSSMGVAKALKILVDMTKEKISAALGI